MSSQFQNATQNVRPSATDSIHAQVLEKTIPQWLVDASPQRKQAFKDAGTRTPDWYLSASPQQRNNIDANFKASVVAQARLDKSMSSFLNIDAFAEPLLIEALKDEYQVEVDVNKTLLCLRRTLAAGILEIELSSFEVMKLPMLQATLHNFEAYECAEGAYHKTSGFVVETTTPGTFEPVSIHLPVRHFLGLCRRLDIGAKYQAYLKSFFQAADAVPGETLREHFIASQKATMRAAAEQALLTGDIEPRDHTMILSVIDGEIHPWMGKKQVWFEDVSLMRKRMTGCVAFSICEKYRYSDEVIVYIPHDPAHPVKRYTAAQRQETFKRLFTARDASQTEAAAPTAYQRFFSQFVAYDQRPYYFSQFTQKAADSPTDLWRSPWKKIIDYATPLSPLIRIKEIPPERPPKLEPEPDPFIALSSLKHEGRGGWTENEDLWSYLYQQHCQKVIADARSHAVPTDDVDVKARELKLAQLMEFGLLSLNLVSMFVPVLGEVMMAVMAGQLLYETVEGAIEWSEGDKRAAKAHLVDVAENIALIGVMAGVGVGVSKLRAVPPEPVIESLHSVTLPNGETRLWKPDVSVYESHTALEASTGPNRLGQHVISGKTYIRMGDKVYEKVFDEAIQKWRIKHPTDSAAYQPILESNGLGAWRHTLERPLDWDRLTLLRRIGHDTQELADEALLRAADVSGVSDAALRKMHVDHSAPPPELTDVLRLFKADARAGQVMEQLNGARPVDGDYFQVLPLVTEMPRWPANRVLEVYEGSDLSGMPAKYGTARHFQGIAAKPPIKISRVDVLKGDMPARIVAALGESEITHLLGGGGARVRDARPTEFGKQFSAYAQTRQPSLFDRFYKGAEPVDPRVARLQRECPGLSEAAAQEVLAHSGPGELERLDARHRLPLRMLEEARWYARQGRQTRAYAGLRSENIASADSRRLALHSLENLPGWPDSVRLEVREQSDTGTLLDSIGNETAPQKKYLIKNGPQFQALNDRGEPLNSVPRQGDNFYASLLHALPDDARSSLGVPEVSQSAELQRKLTDYADAHRADALRLLDPHAKPFKPPVRVNEKLLGYYASGRGRGLTPSLASRVETLYPGEQQADAFIRQHQGLTEAQIYNVLQTRTREWQALNGSLDQWVGAPGSASFYPNTQVAQALKTSWRNAPLAAEMVEAGRLNLMCDVPLPGIDADFSHVHDLTVAGRGLTDFNADGFLERFPNVQKLWIGGDGSYFTGLAGRRQSLSSLPSAVAEMRQLTSLTFVSDIYAFAPDFPERLSALSGLETLHINYTGFNSDALSRVDLSSMTQLKSLRIDAPHTRMEWPAYVEKLEHLERLDLSKTAISRIPDSFYKGHEKQWAGLSLDWSAFSHDAFKPAFEYVQRYKGPLGHIGDIHPMVNGYARGELSFLMGVPGFMERGVQSEIMTVWNTPKTRLAAVEALSAEHAEIFRPFYVSPTPRSGLRQAQLRTDSVSGFGADVFNALVKSWRGAIRQRYGLSADVSVFELPDPALRMAAQKITHLPHLPMGMFPHVKTLRLGWLDAPIEQVRGFTQAFGGVRTVDISGTGLTEVPIFPSAHPELTRLDLHNNNIAMTPTVQAQFDGLTNLEYLDLGSNPLTQLDVSAMTRLKALNVRLTKLQSWPEGAENLPTLSLLDVRYNELSSLPPAALSHEDVLMNTLLSGNEFSVQGEASLRAARQRIEIAKGLPEGALQRFDQGLVPIDFPPTENGRSIARHLLPLPEQLADIQGPEGFVRRLQGLNPAMTQEQAVNRVLQLRRDAMSDVQIEAQINTWYQTYESLTRQLNGWLYIREMRTPRSIVSSETRSMAALRIRELWQNGLIDPLGTADQTLNLNGLQLGDLPELVVQLPSVTSLDLSGVRLTANGSNGFLNAFPQVNRLILSSNELTALPAAVQYMSRLERLELAANHFSDPIPLYQQLGGERLRWLDLSHNNLERFSTTAFNRIETLNLSHNAITHWPDGALAAQRLRVLDLSGNDLTEFPAALLDGSHNGLLAGTDLSDNLELSLTSLEQLRDYSDANGQGNVTGISRTELDHQIERRLTENDTASEGSDDSGDSADDDEDEDDDSDGSDAQAAVQPAEPLLNPALDIAQEALEPWLADTSAELATGRRTTWEQLAEEDNHERFFQLIRLLRDTDEFRYARADLTRRLWSVMDAATENSELRELLFHNAETHGTCIDGRTLTFSELEVRVFVYHALRNISPGRPMLRGQALVSLSRQLFRLDRVDVLAEAAALNRDRAEVRLRYRIGLTSGWPDGLDLPGQPLNMAFDNPIRGRLLADTRASILEAERSDALLNSMVSRDYWTTYLRERYPDDMRVINDAVADERVGRLSDLEDRRERGEVSEQEYDREVIELGKQAEKLRKQKLINLTRREMLDLQTLAGPNEQPGTLSPQPGPSRSN